MLPVRALCKPAAAPGLTLHLRGRAARRFHPPCVDPYQPRHLKTPWSLVAAPSQTTRPAAARVHRVLAEYMYLLRAFGRRGRCLLLSLLLEKLGWEWWWVRSVESE